MAWLDRWSGLCLCTSLLCSARQLAADAAREAQERHVGEEMELQRAADAALLEAKGAEWEAKLSEAQVSGPQLAGVCRTILR